MPVSFPDDLAKRLGDGWCVPLQDTLGELQLRIMLGDAAGVDSATAQTAAAGWGGDRVALDRRPGRRDRRGARHPLGHGRRCGEYAAALAGIVPKLQALGRSASILTPEPNRVVLVTASSDDTMGRLANVLGLAG